MTAICLCNADTFGGRRAKRLVLVGLLVFLLFGCGTWNTERAIAAYNQGNTLREAGKLADSISYYRQALEYDPQMAVAFYNLALALVMDSDSNEAPKLSDGSTPSPGEDVEEAIRLLETLLRRDPRNLAVLCTLGWVSWKVGQPDEALEYYREALAIFPADENALEAVCEIYEALNQPQKALENRKYLVKLVGDSESRYKLAEITALMGNKKEALKLYDDALFYGESASALEGAAEVSEELGLYRRAVEYRIRMLDVEESPADTWWHIARLRLSKIDNYEEGFEALEQALNGNFSDMALIEKLKREVPAAVGRVIVEMIESRLGDEGPQAANQ